MAARTASGGIVATVAASSSAASSVASGGTTRVTRPRASASVAVIDRPVRISSIARALPIARVSRCVPPAPGMTPIRISGWPNVASSAATIMSQAIASSQPPPSATPRTAAMSGRPTAASRSHVPNRPPAVSEAERLGLELADVGAGRERARPGPGDDDRRGRPGRASSVSSASTSWSSRSKLSALSAAGPVEGHERDAVERRSPARPRRGPAPGTRRGRAALRSRRRGPRRVAPRRGVGQRTLLELSFRQYPHPGKPRRSCPARPRARRAWRDPGAISRRLRPAARIASEAEAGIQRRAIVEAHRRRDDQVGLRAERLDDPLDPGLAQAGRARRRAAGAPPRSGARRSPAPRDRRRGGGTARAAWSWGTSRAASMAPALARATSRSNDRSPAWPPRTAPVARWSRSWPAPGATNSRPSRTVRARSAAWSTGTAGRDRRT